MNFHSIEQFSGMGCRTGSFSLMLLSEFLYSDYSVICLLKSAKEKQLKVSTFVFIFPFKMNSNHSNSYRFIALSMNICFMFLSMNADGFVCSRCLVVRCTSIRKFKSSEFWFILSVKYMELLI